MRHRVYKFWCGKKEAGSNFQLGKCSVIQKNRKKKKKRTRKRKKNYPVYDLAKNPLKT